MDECVGKGVLVKLMDGSERRGLVVTVDPQTGAVAIFVQPQETASDALNWKLSVLFPESIVSYEDMNIEEMTVEQLERLHPLLQKEDQEKRYSAADIRRRREALLTLLHDRRIAVSQLPLAGSGNQGGGEAGGEDGEREEGGGEGAGEVAGSRDGVGVGRGQGRCGGGEGGGGSGGGKTVLVMEGLCRIEAPYTSSDCYSTNAMVLERVCALLDEMHCCHAVQ
mmetsp:Transcript_26035/g.41770  ORF Transcript_26035/g.41770 Transcript_26035/m.41770 type:complete len:223 (+) Transcript_26035:25-693(+)